MSRINLHSIQILASIAASRSLSKTAVEMHLTSSAVSKRISELESRFGTPLLLRMSTGVRLTAAGHIVARYADDILSRVSDMSREVSALLSEERGEVRLMSNSTAILLGLLEDIAKFRAAHPGIRIAVSEGGSQEVVESVKSQRANLGVCVHVESMKGLACDPYRQTELAVVVPHEHQLANRPFLVPDDLRNVPVVWKPPISIAQLKEEGGADQRYQDVELSLRSFDVVVRSVKEGVGLAILPYVAIAAGLPAGLAAVRLNLLPQKFELVVCHDPTVHYDRASQQVLAWLRSRSERGDPQPSV